MQYLIGTTWVQVDEEDWDLLSKYNWYVSKQNYVHNRKHNLYLHQLIAERMGINGLADHKDRVGTNNCRSNLRSCNHSQNNMNQELRSDNKTGYKGVSWYKKIQKYRAQIDVNGKRLHLGYFNDREAAKKAYNEAAIKYHGEFANPN